jgi:hypothetical protein
MLTPQAAPSTQRCCLLLAPSIASCRLVASEVMTGEPASSCSSRRCVTRLCVLRAIAFSTKGSSSATGSSS